MKWIVSLLSLLFFAAYANAQTLNGTEEDTRSLERHTAAIREAFGKGDAATVARLHHPDVVKYFGGKNVVTGRDAVQKSAEAWFKTARVEFIENTVESTVFNGETAIQTGIFSIRATPKDGSTPTIARGRAMVVYIKDKNSPTGWLSLREMAQAAPENK